MIKNLTSFVSSKEIVIKMPIKAHLIVQNIMNSTMNGLFEVKAIFDVYNAARGEVFKRPEEARFTSLDQLKSVNKTRARLLRSMEIVILKRTKKDWYDPKVEVKINDLDYFANDEEQKCRTFFELNVFNNKIQEWEPFVEYFCLILSQKKEESKV
jgi:hypothetical protein